MKAIPPLFYDCELHPPRRLVELTTQLRVLAERADTTAALAYTAEEYRQNPGWILKCHREVYTEMVKKADELSEFVRDMTRAVIEK